MEVLIGDTVCVICHRREHPLGLTPKIEEKIITEVIKVGSYDCKPAILITWGLGISQLGYKLVWWVLTDPDTENYFGCGKLVYIVKKNSGQSINKSSDKLMDGSIYSNGADGETNGPSGLNWL